MSSEEALLGNKEAIKTGKSGLKEEVKKLSSLAAPMVVVSVSQYLVQVVSLTMAGHIGELSLSGVAIASSFTDVIGFSLVLGMAGALETLCGQAYGANQYRKLGIYTYCASISLIVVCIPISILWIIMDKLLILIGQDPLVSHEARKYSILLIPALFAYAIQQSLVCYFQSQGLILPVLISSCAILCFHIPVSWALVYKLELGSGGAAISIGLSYWLNVILLVLYMKYSSDCEKTRVTFSSDVLLSTREFISYAVPSGVMVCLEWWSFEILTLLSGLLPNPKLQTSVISTCLTTITLHYFIPYGIGTAASSRISNELGGGNSEAARMAFYALLMLVSIEAVAMSTILFCCRSVLGYAYSSEKEFVDYVEKLTPLLSLSFIMDSFQAAFSAVARGCGWQHLGVYANLGAFYLVGIPVAAVLGFLINLKGVGLWIGILTGSAVQAMLLALVTSSTNWQKEAVKARERIFKETD
ncbi:protein DETOXIFICATION 3 isoform X1 [Ziziphus jujuba]|uniref:Protein DETOXIFICATION n=1 Tax=Ziziphus jujuba TaxID=326968 RepID=A0A6P3YZ04_ZIZJJ|nr:protein DETOXIFICATION 3 isoform X1 [Ziziphus jujuba]